MMDSCIYRGWNMPVLCFTIIFLYIFYLDVISGELHEEMESMGLYVSHLIWSHLSEGRG